MAPNALLGYLGEKFKGGIAYEDATQLCLAIYCIADVLPVPIPKDELTMDGLAEIFAEAARRGLVHDYAAYKAVPYGANYHGVADKGHWIEVMASVLKVSTKVDVDRIKKLIL